VKGSSQAHGDVKVYLASALKFEQKITFKLRIIVVESRVRLIYILRSKIILFYS
jgi:hypothetical protein